MECPICLENNLEPFKMLNCQHSFHEVCLNIWLEKHNSCPLCRQLVTFINGKINKRDYKLSINHDHLVMNHDTHTNILKYSNIKNIEYKKRYKSVILTKKEGCDKHFRSIVIKSDNAFIIFDNIRINMQRLVPTGY